MKQLILVRWIMLLFYVTSFSLPSHGQAAQDNQKSCRGFVQSFYDWYVKRPVTSQALKYRASAFSPELFRALKDDEEAQAKSQTEIVGLDEDPILSGNDRPPDEHYVVSHANLTGETTCWVVLHQVWSGGKGEKTVAAQLQSNAEGWHFVNFFYSALPNSDLSASVSHGGLLAILKNLREAREKAATTPSEAKPAPQSNSGRPTSNRTPATKPAPQN